MAAFGGSQRPTRIENVAELLDSGIPLAGLDPGVRVSAARRAENSNDVGGRALTMTGGTSRSNRHGDVSRLHGGTLLGTGHAAGDVHAKNYLKHPPHELKKVIDQIPDPTS
jgi:hypothetical protein